MLNVLKFYNNGVIQAVIENCEERSLISAADEFLVTGRSAGLLVLRLLSTPVVNKWVFRP